MQLYIWVSLATDVAFNSTTYPRHLNFLEQTFCVAWFMSLPATERTDFEIGILVTEFIADRDSQEHTGQTTGCRHGDADGLILDEQSQPTEGRRLVALLGTEGTEGTKRSRGNL